MLLQGLKFRHAHRARAQVQYTGVEHVKLDSAIRIVRLDLVYSMESMPPAVPLSVPAGEDDHSDLGLLVLAIAIAVGAQHACFCVCCLKRRLAGAET